MATRLWYVLRCFGTRSPVTINSVHLSVLEHTNDDMTAIASAFTSEGFVIGADGRQLGKDKKIFTESAQKIFNFTYRRIDVVYAWCGETGVLSCCMAGARWQMKVEGRQSSLQRGAGHARKWSHEKPTKANCGYEGDVLCITLFRSPWRLS
jgi:hypothetical protein